MAAPSFSSFPDIEPGPSTRPRSRHDSERERSRERDKPRHKDDDKHRRKKHSSTDRSRRSSKPGDKHHGRERAREHDRDRDRDRDGERDRGRDRERERRHETKHESEASIAFSSLYIIDQRGDPLNITYGGLHASSVPKYSRSRKSVLGMPVAYRISSDKGKGVEIGLLGKRRSRRYIDHHVIASLRSEKVYRIVKPTGRPFPLESEDQGFIPLSSSKKKEPQRSSFRELLVDAEHHSSSTSDSDEEDDMSEEDDTTLTLTAEQETIKSLETSLAANPSSLTAWFSLLAHSLAAVPMDSKNASKVRAELTLSIFSRALKADESNGRSARFRVSYLKAGASMWTVEQLYYEWEDALRVATNKPQIWLSWYNWRLKFHTQNGNINAITEDAARALRALSDSELARIGILWRTAVFFKEAGFRERATALLQAQIELAIFCPQSIRGAAFESQLASLEEFWDSEVPRVGESAAKGWAAYMAVESNSIAQPTTSLVEHSPPAHTHIRDPYQRWCATERHLDAGSNIPLRTSSQSDDPYAVVLFSDVQSFLSPIRSKEAREWLQRCWLSLLGLHIPGLSAAFDSVLACGVLNDVAEQSDAWMLPYNDSMLNRLFPSSMRTAEDWDSIAGVIVARESARYTVFGPVKEWRLNSLHPLEGTGPRGEGRMWELPDVQGLDIATIRNFFEQTRNVTDIDWSILEIAFEAAQSPKSTTKLTKKLLSESPKSLILWAAHARIERIRGRTDEARKVYQANLSHSVVSPDLPMRLGEVQMLWDWAEMEWLDGKVDASLRIIHSLFGVDAASGIAVLKIKRALDDRINVNGPDRVAWNRLRALFELLTTGSLSAALETFNGPSNNDSQEALDTSALLIAYHHTCTLKVPCPPALLRERVEAAIQHYPENSIVLGIFLEAERGQSIWGKVRQLYSETPSSVDRQRKRLIRRIWDVWGAGRDRGHYDAERARLILDSASSYINVSPLLWRMLIELEIRASNTSRAKNTLFRATGECPWVKDIYMLAYESLRPLFSSDELNRWTDSIAEHGLRMRQELEPYLEGWRGPQSEDDGSHDGADSDIEHNAEELRRLMPY